MVNPSVAAVYAGQRRGAGFVQQQPVDGCRTYVVAFEEVSDRDGYPLLQQFHAPLGKPEGVPSYNPSTGLYDEYVAARAMRRAAKSVSTPVS